MAFTQVAGLHPKRHFFDKSFVYKTTMKFGELIPFLAEEVVPGDNYKIGNNAVVRVSPLVAPILDNIYIRTEYFFVPDRLLADDDNFSNFISGGRDGDYTTYPFGELNWDDSMDFDGSLSDYFGLTKAYKIFDDVTKDVAISDKFHRAYIKVWNDFYRDENLQEEVSMSSIDFDMMPLRRAWKKDYFTSALLSPQRGTAPAIPIVGTVPVTGSPGHIQYGDKVVSADEGITSTFRDVAPSVFWGQDTSNDLYFGSPLISVGDPLKYKGRNVLQSRQDNLNNTSWGYIDSVPANMNLVANITPQAGLTFNASDVRKLMQIQKFMERNMRAGVRFNEFLLAHFGTAPRDEVLQRPRFLGSTKTPILISEVLQTSQSTDDSPQGRLSGKGLGLSAGMIGSHTFEEFGIVLGLASIVPDLSYQSQGINKKFTRFTKYDYYFPEFAHLSEQPIKKHELFFDTTASSNNTNNKTFGYQGIYDDMRHNRDMVTGQFRSDASASLDYWHLARFFLSTPALNSDFITCNPTYRIFEVQDEPPFQVCIGNILKAVRPMPKIAEPGLVDHF